MVVKEEQDQRKEQFLGRDSTGLLPKDKYKSEEQVRARYYKLSATAAFVIAPVLCTVLYFVVTTAMPSEKTMIATKLVLLREYDLIYVYIGYYIVVIGRVYNTINANGTRAAARVDRPCQHVYQIMDESGPFSKAPYVLMVNDSGPIGRFNRAQRACFNLDEQIPLFVAGFLLQGAVFGKMSLVIALLFCYGAIRFADLYKEHHKSRSGGFGPVIFAVHCNSTFVLMAAILACMAE
jgi:hypothetical protein